MNLTVSGIVGGVNDHNSTVNMYIVMFKIYNILIENSFFHIMRPILGSWQLHN